MRLFEEEAVLGDARCAKRVVHSAHGHHQLVVLHSSQRRKQERDTRTGMLNDEFTVPSSERATHSQNEEKTDTDATYTRRRFAWWQGRCRHSGHAQTWHHPEGSDGQEPILYRNEKG
jgi:hypothetical protein